MWWSRKVCLVTKRKKSIKTELEISQILELAAPQLNYEKYVKKLMEKMNKILKRWTIWGEKWEFENKKNQISTIEM